MDLFAPLRICCLLLGIHFARQTFFPFPQTTEGTNFTWIFRYKGGTFCTNNKILHIMSDIIFFRPISVIPAV